MDKGKKLFFWAVLCVLVVSGVVAGGAALKNLTVADLWVTGDTIVEGDARFNGVADFQGGIVVGIVPAWSGTCASHCSLEVSEGLVTGCNCGS